MIVFSWLGFITAFISLYILAESWLIVYLERTEGTMTEYLLFLSSSSIPGQAIEGSVDFLISINTSLYFSSFRCIPLPDLDIRYVQ